MRSSRALAAVALAAATVTAAAACSGGGSSSSTTTPTTSGSAQTVTMTWWNNATNGALLKVWQDAIKAFEASHPGVIIKNVPIQNEQFTTKIPLALQSNDPPSIYQQWGSGAMATQLKSGKLADISGQAQSWISALGSAAGAWSDGSKWYGVPYDYHVVGFWYNKADFKKAGITAPPATIDQLKADDTKLRAVGITPIAIGSKDRWPDAFWWEYFAVRECPTETIKSAMSSVSLSDPCFTKANNDLTNFMASNPFQTGFNGTPAQQGAGSSAGMVGTGKAAMELMGDWEPGVISGLVSGPASKVYANLGWFPFPAVTGGKGDPKVMLGGGDGFSCTTGAPEPACAEFLQFLTTPDEQKQIMSAGVGLPVNPAAASALVVPADLQALAANTAAPYIAVYFDQALPTQPGQNLDTAVANFFAGQGNVDQIPSSVTGPA